MVWALQFDGDSYCGAASPFLAHTQTEFTLIYKGVFPNSATVDTYVLIGRTGNDQAQIRTDTGGTFGQLRVRFGAAGSIEMIDLLSEINTGSIVEIKLVRSAGTLTTYIDGLLIDTRATTAIGNQATHVGICQSGTITTAAHQFVSLETYSDATETTLEYRLSADDSVRDGGTDQPVLTDTVAANNATGVNFNSFDPTVWVDLGGGGVIATANFPVTSILVAGGSVNLTTTSNNNSDSNFTNLGTVSIDSTSDVGSISTINNNLNNIVTSTLDSAAVSNYSSSSSVNILNSNNFSSNGNTSISVENVVSLSANFTSESTFASLINVISAGEILATIDFNVNGNFGTIASSNVTSNINTNSISSSDVNSNNIVNNVTTSSVDSSIAYSGITIVNLSNDTTQISTLSGQAITSISTDTNLSTTGQYDNLVTLNISGSSVNSVNSIFTAFGIVGTFNPLLSASISVVQDTNVISIYYITNTIDIKEVTNTITINNS